MSRVRRLIEGGLTSFLRVFPPKPIRACLDIVRAIWAKLDDMGADGGKTEDVTIEIGRKPPWPNPHSTQT